MNLGCPLIYASVYVEKGMGLILPGYTPDPIGNIYQYFPSIYEFRIAAGIFALGFLLFTFMVRVAIAIMFEEFTVSDIRAARPVHS